MIDDELYQKAVRVVVEDRKASTSYVQRMLRIGYNSAAKQIERMEREGVVGPPDHVGRREVLAPADNSFAGWDAAAEACAARQKVYGEAATRPVIDVATEMVDRFGADGARAVVEAVRAVHGDVLDEDTVRMAAGMPRRDLDEHGVAHLVQIVERAESLIADRDEINQTLRDLFSFAKGIGFDGRAIRARIKERALAKEVRIEREATDEVYRAALGIEGPDFVIPLPKPAVDTAPKTKKITAREKAMRDALALIRADRATSIN